MADTKISALTAGSSVSGTDIFPAVQTAGVGPLKITASQIASYVWSVAAAADITVSGVKIGIGAGAVSTNVLFGSSALTSNTTGSTNVAVGYSTLKDNTTGYSNVAIGSSALSTNQTGYYNVAIGVNALSNTGIDKLNNIAIGYSALINAGHSYNVAIGGSSLSSSSVTGYGNVGIGYNTLSAVTSGARNVGIGYQGGSAITTGSNNVIIGGYTGSAAPISATNSGHIVFSDGAGTIRGYFDSSSNFVYYKLQATSAAAPTISSAATIVPTTPIAFVSGTTTVNTITAPSPISAGGGQITLIPTGLWSTGTSGNIALATTAVVSKALIMTYDTTTAKWYPSY